MSLAEAISKVDHLSDEQRECIENCNEAAEVCEWCADECLGSEDMEQCARLCRDVADIASLHARFMARDSAYSDHLAGACVEACEACADECETHDADHCQLCAEVLRECAESCRDMIAYASVEPRRLTSRGRQRCSANSSSSESQSPAAPTAPERRCPGRPPCSR